MTTSDNSYSCELYCSQIDLYIGTNSIYKPFHGMYAIIYNGNIARYNIITSIMPGYMLIDVPLHTFHRRLYLRLANIISLGLLNKFKQKFTICRTL
jgi:hypothetical protein